MNCPPAGGPVVGHIAIRSFGLRYLPDRTEHPVHREKRRRHPGSGLQEGAAREAVALRIVLPERLDQPFDPALAFRLRQRVVLAVGHDLCGHRRAKRRRLRRRNTLDLLPRKPTGGFLAHGTLLL
jgi:hypothetical protein